MKPSRASLWITLAQAGLLGLVAGLAGYLLLTHVFAAPARAQGPEPRQFPGQVPGGPPPFPGGGFPGGEERKIVARFDKNGDQRLDGAERKAARAALAEEPSTRGFGGRRGGGPGGFSREPVSPGPKLSPSDVRSYPTASLYDLTTLRTIFLEFENADWEPELAAFYNTDVEVPATATVDGKVYKNVGVHFRGMSSYMMVPEGAKRSLNLSFDFVDEKQDLAGYRTVNLLNVNGDPTFVRPILYSEIARQYIPAPKMNYTRVVINGESWGVYVNAQQFNKDFTRDYFQSTKGARWKVPGSPGGRGGMEYMGDDPSAYKRTYEIKTKDDPKAWADLIKMFRVLNETPSNSLETALRPLLDVDGALKFLALDVALVNSDGYWARASDYSIYQDEKGQFHVVPHDVNEALAEVGGGRGGPPRGGFRGPEGRGPDGQVMPGPPPGPFGGGRRGRGMMGGGVDLDPLVGLDDPGKPLRSKLLAVPALRERYLSYVREIADKWLDWRTLEPRVQQYQSLIADAVKADTRKLYSFEAFTNDVAGSERSVKSFVERRRAFLLKTP
jgi:spore coat protein CotH